jgi:hypothetical protein
MRGPCPQYRLGPFAQRTWPTVCRAGLGLCGPRLRDAVYERTPERSPLSGRASQRGRRWSKGRRSSIHGREATRWASGWRRQLTGASCRREGWKNQDDGGVLRRGGGSGRRRGPMSGWRGRELGSTFHGRKSGKRGLRFRSPWKSSRRQRRLDSNGGALQAWMMAWSGRACVRRRHGSNSWGRDRKGCRDAGARSRQRP